MADKTIIGPLRPIEAIGRGREWKEDEIPAPPELPDDVLKRFPSLTKWQEDFKNYMKRTLSQITGGR